MTEVERVLWYGLRRSQLGWRFRRQHPIPPYVVDFACLEARLVVDADGGQHALPDEHELRDEELRRKGWRVLRFWNNDILGNRAGVLQTIAAALGLPPQAPTPALPRGHGGGSDPRQREGGGRQA